MIIGSGFIAKAFSKLYAHDENILIYAAGVSNSQCINDLEYMRDKERLKKTLLELSGQLFVYISTCSVNSNTSLLSSRYILHKKSMEEMVKNYSKYLILRLPQIAGHSSNQFTLLNYFKNKIELRKKIIILKNCYRNLIDIEHVIMISEQIIRAYKNNLIINIANPKPISTIEILNKMEMVLNLKAQCDFVDGSLDNYAIDISQMLMLADCSACQFDDEYCTRLIRKYYSKNKLS